MAHMPSPEHGCHTDPVGADTVGSRNRIVRHATSYVFRRRGLMGWRTISRHATWEEAQMSARIWLFERGIHELVELREPNVTAMA